MSFVVGLTCHECGAKYPLAASYVCSECMGPLEVSFDYDAIRKVMTRQVIESRPPSLWRYLELLPVEEPRTGFYSGFTPLVRATRLAKELGLSELYIKDDSVNHPTFSYKDRVVSVAASKAVEFNFPVFSCASTGNLAGSVAAHAARIGRKPQIIYPPELPVAQRAADIAHAIRKSPVVIVSGETGSGKTTQLPKICLEAGRGARGKPAAPPAVSRRGHVAGRQQAAIARTKEPASLIAGPGTVAAAARPVDAAGVDAQHIQIGEGAGLEEHLVHVALQRGRPLTVPLNSRRIESATCSRRACGGTRSDRPFLAG